MPIRPATPADAAALCALYNPYILNSTISFEELPVTPGEMARRLTEVQASLP